MKTAIILSALAISGIQAQGQAPSGAKGPPKGKGGAKGGNSGIMGALGQLYGKNGVPLGPAPKGCAAHEVIVGSCSQLPSMIPNVNDSSRDLRARPFWINCWRPIGRSRQKSDAWRERAGICRAGETTR
jgi:hypothetical protein